MASKLTCKCLKHEELSKDKKFQIFKHTAKKIKKRTYDKMMEMELLANKDSSLCTACASFVENQATYGTEAKQQKRVSKCIEECIEKIEHNIIENHELIKLSEALAKYMNTAIVNDIENYKLLYKNDAFIDSMSFTILLDRLNPLIVSFITSVCNLTDGDTRKQGTLVKIIELLYFQVSGSMVTPLHFVENMLVYFLTGSRQVCDLLNKYAPAGSYQTLRAWLDSRAVQRNETPEGDAVCFFDNNQILSRNWRVKYNSKYSVNVITTVLYIIPEPVTNLQTEIHLNPFMWMKTFDGVDISKEIEIENKSHEKVFNKYRLDFIQKVIDEIIPTLDEDMKDGVDKNDYNLSTFSKYSKETVLIDDNSIIFEKKKDAYDPYKDVENGKISKPKIVVGDPIMENPCSYVAVEKILEKLLNDKGNRDWIIVGCDGSPYLLACRMIENYAKCPECLVTFKTKEIFNLHCHNIHKKHIDFENNRKFKNILLLPGLGHFEINMVKAIFKLLWPVCLEDMAKLLGFRSIKALTHCKAATNHHQSWQMLQILLYGTAMELLLPYVRKCISNKLKCTAVGFLNFANDMKDPCYIFFNIVIFSYVLALNLFRCGVRRNNYSVTSSARFKISPLYYGLNMTTYQEIEFRDRMMRSLCPDELSEYLKDNECISVSGHGSKCESGDFILESQNRRIKRWMPPGIPNQDRWRRVCRNLDRIEKLKDRLSVDLEDEVLEELDCSCRKTDLSEEIFYWRKLLREKEYFSNPSHPRTHVSLSGNKLDAELINFSVHCRENQKIYFKHKKSVKLNPVFIIPEERESFNDVKNQTKEVLAAMIEEKIDCLEDYDEAEKLLTEWKEIRKEKKAVMINFYKKIKP